MINLFLVILLTARHCILVFEITVWALSIDFILRNDFQINVLFLKAEPLVLRRTSSIFWFSQGLWAARASLRPPTHLILAITLYLINMLPNLLRQSLLNSLVISVLPAEVLRVKACTVFSALRNYDILLETLTQLNCYFDVLGRIVWCVLLVMRWNWVGSAWVVVMDAVLLNEVLSRYLELSVSYVLHELALALIITFALPKPLPNPLTLQITRLRLLIPQTKLLLRSLPDLILLTQLVVALRRHRVPCSTHGPLLKICLIYPKVVINMSYWRRLTWSL